MQETFPTSVTFSSQAVAIDVHSARIGKEGVLRFVSHYRREEVEEFRDRILGGVSSLGRASPEEMDRNVLGTISKHFPLVCLTIFQAARTRKALGGKRISASPGAGGVFHDLVQGKNPSLRNEITYFGQGPKGSRRWLGLARAMRNALMSRKGIVRREFRSFDPIREIVCTTIYPMLARHAESVEGKVVFQNLDFWFRPVPEMILGKAISGDLSDSLGDDLFGVALEAFKASGESLYGPSEFYLKRWTDVIPGLVRWHLQDVLSRRKMLPLNLWTGTGGMWWSRILRHAVRSAGGRVTGHDHWTSVGYRIQHSKTATDFEACDEFVTMTPAQATGLKRGARPDHLIQRSLPEVIAMPRNTRVGALRAPERREKWKTGKRVMYVMNMYCGGQAYLDPFDPDITVLDWQARLISKLQEWSFEVLIKAHPECRIGLPQALVDLAGGAKILDPFESVQSQADFILFDYPMTTTFASAMMADRPVVFVDFGMLRCVPEALELLKKRYQIISGYMDENCRFQVNWDELQRAFDEALYRTNSEFFDTYFSF